MANQAEAGAFASLMQLVVFQRDADLCGVPLLCLRR
jgi:hypothetical protein